MVPVIKDADRRDIWSCAAEVARLSEAARAATVTLQDLSGSTITITSLGALGGVVTTPVINAPEVAIIGVNKIMDSTRVRRWLAGGAAVHEPLVVVRPSCGRWPRCRRVHPGDQAAPRDSGAAVHALSRRPGGRFLQDRGHGGAAGWRDDAGSDCRDRVHGHARPPPRSATIRAGLRAWRASRGARRTGGVPQFRRGIRVGARAGPPLTGKPTGRRAACPRGVRRGRAHQFGPCRRGVRLAEHRDTR